ncbi:uncharacterized protein [Paramisgurnus dabryanus]|uniref:uncharacterized protein n=1 Tax=Paramisgurnus dabryanus TaxID=90735 RepID=UPI003CCF6087
MGQVLLDSADCDGLTVALDQNRFLCPEFQVTLEKNQLALGNQDCVEKNGGEKNSQLSPVQLLNEDQSFHAPTEGLKQVCRHDVTSTTISSMDKCAACVGPVAAFKWIGLRCKLCSSFWHKSCYFKLYDKQSSMDTSSEEELSDEEYIPQSESESQSDSSEDLTTRTKSQDQANHPSLLKKVVPSQFSLPVPPLDSYQGKGKQISMAREAEFDLLCHEEDVELDSNSDSDLRREIDVVMSSPSLISEEACSGKLMNAAD